MMPHVLQTDSLPVLRAWARQHCQNAIQDAIRDFAPDHFTWDDCDQVEARMLTDFEPMIAHLTVDLLRNLRYMRGLITQVAADTVRLLRSNRTPITATMRSARQ
jgi:hypothetical protein